MNKKIFIVHGWDGYPEEGWFPWLKKELETKGFKVAVPQLPQAENPRIQTWVPKLAEVVGKADENIYFVGHSMGCQTIVRYLETLPAGITIGGAVFVAGFFKRLTGLEDDVNVQAIVRHWLNAPIHFEQVKHHILKSVAIFSDNDPYVPLDNQDDFRDKLGSQIVIEKNMGHFSGKRDEVTKLPIVLNALLNMV